MKNSYKIRLLLIIFFVIFIIFSNELFAAPLAPLLNCTWLPWCINDTGVSNVSIGKISNLIWQSIKYVAVIAVLSLMVSWIMYLISGWEEEKTKKAKRAIIWSLAWVFLSISAWSIINIINSIKIS